VIDAVVALALKDVDFCLIGAAALAVHGVARFSVDIDLLTMDSGVADSAFWTLPADVRRGDFDDPFEAVIRVSAAQTPYDVLVGRGKVMRHAVQTAVFNARFGCKVATDEALLLLKLEAGGPIDIQDIHSLIEVDRLVAKGDLVARAQLSLLSARGHGVWLRYKQQA
jgi:hypothetical protein